MQIKDFDAIKKLVKPDTIWRLRYGQIIMVVEPPKFVKGIEFEVVTVLQENNTETFIYLDSLYEATLIN